MTEKARVLGLVDAQADKDDLRAGLARFEKITEDQYELLNTIEAIRLFVKEGPLSKGELSGAGGAKGGKKDDKAKGKEAAAHGEKGGEKKEKAPKENATTKACKKEGGKKGCSLADLNGMGGTSFFTVNAEEPKEWKYFEQFIEAMNAEPDPDASEERKGGAKDLAKLCLAGNADLMLLVCQVPKALQADKGITPREWVTTVLTDVKGFEELSAAEEQITGQIKADPANDVFPIKIKDQVTGNSFQFLRSKKVIPDSTDDDDDWVPDEDAMAEAIGSW